MTISLEEQVARAIATADEQNGAGPYELVIQNKHSREALFDRSRAAIAAVRSSERCQKDIITQRDQAEAYSTNQTQIEYITRLEKLLSQASDLLSASMHVIPASCASLRARIEAMLER